MSFLVNVNMFQSMVDTKVQLEILNSDIPKIRALSAKTEMVRDYISSMVFDRAASDFLNGHANYNVAKDNFISFWKRRLGIEFERRTEIERIWENALVNADDYKNASMPLMVFQDGRAMSVDSFTDAILDVLLLA